MKRILTSFLMILFLSLSCITVYAQEIDIEGDYGYMINRDTGEVMYDKNGHEKMYPASMTKMMTVIVALENNNDLDKKVLITSDMITKMIAENASMAGFCAGDEVTIRDLCYGALLPSGAECVEALATETAGSEAAFVELMNEKAQTLGMNDTHFVNVTGLHDADHYSTCYDLSLLVDHCLDNETFRTMFGTAEYTTEPVLSHPDGLELVSTSLVALKDSYVLGAKTGFTYPALRCLASYSSDGNETYITIVAHCPDGYTPSKAIVDTETLTDYFFENYEMQTFVHEGEVVTTLPVLYSLKEESIDISMDHDVTLTLLKDSEVNYTFADLSAPLKKGDVIGSLDIVNEEGVAYHEDILLDHDIDTNGFIITFYKPLIFIKHHVYLCLGIATGTLVGLTGLVIIIKRKKK